MSQKADGYRGIWFALGQVSQYGDKYSGGLATYTAKHVPLAIYAPQVNRTYFVYGGSRDGKRHLQAMASYFDHDGGVVPRPTIVHDKGGVDDPHEQAKVEHAEPRQRASADPAAGSFIYFGNYSGSHSSSRSIVSAYSCANSSITLRTDLTWFIEPTICPTK